MISNIQAEHVQLEVFIVLLFLFSVFVILIVLRNNKLKLDKNKYEFEKEKNALLKHYEYLSKYLNDIILLTDDNGNIKVANEKAFSVYGYSQDELYSLPAKFLRIPELREEFDELKKWVNSEVGTIYETTHIKKNGERFPAEVSLRSFQIEGSMFLQAIIRDITERKKVEEELIKAKEKAEEINKLKSNFLANMSHELRTPLIGILGYAELIINDSFDNDLKEKVGVIYKSGKKLNETLNAILDLSKIESEKVYIKYEKFNLGEIIKESVMLYKTLAEDKNLEIKYSSGTNGLLVELDKKMFSKVINNLLSNAIKYTNQGEVIISTTNNNGVLKIEVKDTGIGIPEDKLDIIFKPFRQVSEGYNRRFDGTGLGLTITKMLVELMNGRIYFESTHEEGSNFIIEFPVYADQNKDHYLLNVEKV